MRDRSYKMLILLNFAQKLIIFDPPCPLWHSEEYSPMIRDNMVTRLRPDFELCGYNNTLQWILEEK